LYILSLYASWDALGPEIRLEGKIRLAALRFNMTFAFQAAFAGQNVGIWQGVVAMQHTVA